MKILKLFINWISCLEFMLVEISYVSYYGFTFNILRTNETVLFGIDISKNFIYINIFFFSFKIFDNT